MEFGNKKMETQKKPIIIASIFLIILLAVFAVLTAIRMGKLGTRPIAPNAPESVPKASEQIPPNVTPAFTACKSGFAASPGPSPTPCMGKIEGRVYLDISTDDNHYRVSHTEVFGPPGITYRVDYRKPSDIGFFNQADKACTDDCAHKSCTGPSCPDSACAANFANGSYSTGNIEAGSNYAIRLVLASTNWTVMEVYLADPSSQCVQNQVTDLTGQMLVTPSNVGSIYGLNLACNETKTIWFGIRQNLPSPTPTATITPLPTATPTLPVCLIPSPKPILHGPTPPVNSRVDLSWNCDQPEAKCFALERYEYAPSGSCPGTVSCGNPPANPVVTIMLTPRPSNIPSSTPCTYVDTITQDKDKCVAYKIVARDFTGGKTCTDCTASDGRNCCIVKSDPIKICGIPAQPTTLTRTPQGSGASASVVLTWVDNSNIEQGFRLYRRETGADDFDITQTEVPIKVLAPKTGTGAYTFTDNSTAGTAFSGAKVAVYRYSVRAYTERCGCAQATPTPTAGVLPVCTNVQVTVAGAGNLSNLKIGDILTFTVNFSGTVEDVGVVIKKDGVRVATYTAGGSRTNTWTSPPYTITSLGSYEVMGFIKVNGNWQ